MTMASLLQVRFKYVSIALHLATNQIPSVFYQNHTVNRLAKLHRTCYVGPRLRWTRCTFSDRTKDTAFSMNDDFGDFESYRKRKEKGYKSSGYDHDHFGTKSHGTLSSLKILEKKIDTACQIFLSYLRPE